MSAIDRCRIGLTPLSMALAAALVPTLAFGQQHPISEADLARARSEQPTITDADIAQAQQRYRQLPGLESPPATAPPNLDALPIPLTHAMVDLSAVAEGYQQQVDTTASALNEGTALYVFVSLSIPEPSLRRLLAQAAQARATVLVRGLSEGSLRKTAARLQSLIGQQPLALHIDPRPFERFDIGQVPTFVLASAALSSDCTDRLCQEGTPYIRTSGDVSLDYALAYMQRTAPPAWVSAADPYLQRLQQRTTP